MKIHKLQTPLHSIRLPVWSGHLRAPISSIVIDGWRGDDYYGELPSVIKCHQFNFRNCLRHDSFHSKYRMVEFHFHFCRCFLYQSSLKGTKGKNKRQTTNLHQHSVLLIWHLRVGLEGEQSGRCISVSGTFNFEHHICVLLACVWNFNALSFNANQFPTKTGSQPWQRNNRCRFSIRQSPPCCWQCHNGFMHQQPSTSQTTPSTQWFHCISTQFIFV